MAGFTTNGLEFAESGRPQDEKVCVLIHAWDKDTGDQVRIVHPGALANSGVVLDERETDFAMRADGSVMRIAEGAGSISVGDLGTENMLYVSDQQEDLGIY